MHVAAFSCSRYATATPFVACDLMQWRHCSECKPKYFSLRNEMCRKFLHSINKIAFACVHSTIAFAAYSERSFFVVDGIFLLINKKSAREKMRNSRNAWLVKLSECSLAWFRALGMLGGLNGTATMMNFQTLNINYEVCSIRRNA